MMDYDEDGGRWTKLEKESNDDDYDMYEGDDLFEGILSWCWWTEKASASHSWANWPNSELYWSR